MNDPLLALQALLQPTGPQPKLFPPNSRYAGVPTATLETAPGRSIVYLRRRLLPNPATLSLLHEHEVVEGDRIDNIAALHLGDPEQFWRVCDANGALRPDELTETVGRRLRITLPAGIAGGGGA